MMEFKISNVEFAKAVSEVSNVVSNKTTQPILAGIKLIAKADCLILIGSNSDIVIERKIPIDSEGLNGCKVYKTGSIVISAKYLNEIIKKLPNEIHLKVTENQSVIIQSEDIITKLNGFNSTEYPSLPYVNFSNNIRIASDALIDIIKQTVFASSQNESRPVLTGVNFSFEKNSLTCAATNSQRLSLKRHKLNSNINGSFIVPNTALIELVKLFGDCATEIDIFTADNHIVFKSNTKSLYSRLIEGNYPNISGLIPQQSSTTVTLDTKRLLKGIDRASIFASEWRNNNIKFQVSEKSKVKISSLSSEMGQIEEIQDIKNISGDEELNITLDGKFMIDALKAIKEDEVSICFNGSMSPILIMPVGNPSHLQLISPVRSN
jgi:DNA polymerase III subunit beta